MKRMVVTWIGSLIAIALTGCGQQGITITSNGFATRAALFGITGTEFKICVERLRLINSNGDSVSADGSTVSGASSSNGEINFTPGLIDLSASLAANWGSTPLPTGFTLAEMRVKVHKDASLCGMDYSVVYAGVGTPSDLEFRWTFNPPVTLAAGTKQIDLNFNVFVTALQAALTSKGAQMSSNDIDAGISGAEDTAELK